MTDTSKATPRPWVVDGEIVEGKVSGHIHKVAGCYALPFEGCDPEANAALITKAVNEYDALRAVAEAAEHAAGDTIGETWAPVRAALAALRKVKEGAG